MSRILAKIGHYEGSPTVGGFPSDIRPPQLRWAPIFPFFVFRAIGELIARTVTSDESHLVQRRLFRWVANGVRISLLFPPTSITSEYLFSRFRVFRSLGTNSTNNNFRRNAHSEGSPKLGGFQSDCRPAQLRRFPSPNFTILPHAWKTNSPSRHL